MNELLALVESLISEQLPPRSEPAIVPLYVPPLTAADYGFASGASTATPKTAVIVTLHESQLKCYNQPPAHVTLGPRVMAPG